MTLCRDFGADPCKQCDWPACHFACAARWEEPALRIDSRTGARYVDRALCRGCASCLKACPLTPEHSVISSKSVGRRRKYYKCDLCKDREDGQVCVRICPGKALSYIPAEERGR